MRGAGRVESIAVIHGAFTRLVVYIKKCPFGNGTSRADPLITLCMWTTCINVGSSHKPDFFGYKCTVD